ncbi:uncharacterized protein PV09_06984 [Verruconis gallopava]|uniref:CHK kinase-like domain-containing protein n=1 Tax=Verruconis gallopava TaxID=253628 RepID=A0A0D2A4X0_9PEZI|nr:uncharacterized protein PV09_06984 [Verruconis gallopava]KIW01505.1 hypothetical protein PV09_06984 [Verruconis gallopava]
MATSRKSLAEQIACDLLESKSFRLVSCKVLQSLWAGYGHICRIEAVPASSASDVAPTSLILKHIEPPVIKPNGRLVDEGHIRKILSYQVEQFFYTKLAPQLPKQIAVAACIASVSSDSHGFSTATLLSDLCETFPIAGEKRVELSERQVYAALDWLAGFHGFWWTRVKQFDRAALCPPPMEYVKANGIAALRTEGVWLNGGYTYLATRMTEYSSLKEDASSEWSSALCSGAPSVAELASIEISPQNAANVDYITLIHGDVKSENLFSTADGSSVAFYDFQYVGLGLGVSDLAKLFTCSVPAKLLPADKGLGAQEEVFLRYYHDKLELASGRTYPWDTFIRHWEFALLDWLRFQASWGFWGNTDWLEERGRGILQMNGW